MKAQKKRFSVPRTQHTYDAHNIILMSSYTRKYINLMIFYFIYFIFFGCPSLNHIQGRHLISEIPTKNNLIRLSKV